MELPEKGADEPKEGEGSGPGKAKNKDKPKIVVFGPLDQRISETFY
jgi:hypothetical protein